MWDPRGFSPQWAHTMSPARGPAEHAKVGKHHPMPVILTVEPSGQFGHPELDAKVIQHLHYGIELCSAEGPVWFSNVESVQPREGCARRVGRGWPGSPFPVWRLWSFATGS